MKKGNTKADDKKALRDRAEALVGGKPKDIARLSAEEIRELVHELQVHQIELEMQNEELRMAQLELEATRNKYYDLYDFAPVGYLTLDAKGLIEEINLAGADLLGAERSSLKKKPLSRFIAQDFQDVYYLHRNGVLESRTKQACELKLVSKKGEPRYVQMESIAAEDEGGSPNQMRAVISDITERRRAEEALQNAHDELEERVKERIADLAKANEQLVASKEGLEERLRFETLLAETSSRFVNVPADQVDGEIEGAQRRICELLDLDRSTLWQVSGKEPMSLILTHMYQPQGTQPDPEQWREELFPWSRQKVLAGETVTITKMSDLPPEAGRDRESFGLVGTKSDVIVPLSVGGAPPFGLLTFAIMREERDWPETVVKGFQLIAQVLANALARKRADEALRESEARLSLATDASGAGLWIMELETGHVWVTTKTREMFDFALDEELNFESFFQVIHPEDREQVKQAVQQALQSGETLRSDYRIVLPDGSLRWIVARGKRYLKSTGEPDRIMGVSLDITERKRAEQEAFFTNRELMRMDRLSHMGELTASLGHEINQPLTAILSNAEAAQRFLSQSPPDINEVRQILDDIVRDDRRASDVVGKVRALVRKEEPNEEILDLNKTIQEVVGLIRGESLLLGLSITMKLSPELKMIRGDRIQLQQVFLNLILNSAAAMRNSPWAQRKIIVRTAMPDEATVKASVTDFGNGIDENSVERLFEPFYTTKPEGLGMGLSISRGIIKAHGGTLEASNNPEGGATFAFTLPAHQGDPDL
jgi:two-component system, LuxR family, sensor kinase FixL